MSIDGLGKNEKKTYIEETLEEIFNDGDWLPETQEAEVKYFISDLSAPTNRAGALVSVRAKSKRAFKYKKSTNTYKYKSNNMVNSNGFA